MQLVRVQGSPDTGTPSLPGSHHLPAFAAVTSPEKQFGKAERPLGVRKAWVCISGLHVLGQATEPRSARFPCLENPFHPMQEAGPRGAQCSVTVSKLPLSQGFVHGKAATLL